MASAPRCEPVQQTAQPDSRASASLIISVGGSSVIYGVSALASPTHPRPHIMQTAPLHSSHASPGQRVWASAGVASICVGKGHSCWLRSGKVRGSLLCTGIGMLWRGGDAPAAVATASVRPNPALNRSAVSGFGLRLLGQRARLALR